MPMREHAEYVYRTKDRMNDDHFEDARLSALVERCERMTIEQIASVCHEANRAYCAALGDHSQVAWLYAPEWQRHSAIAGVKATIAHPSITPEQQHQLWTADKVRDGWIYGPVKDAQLKEHPCLVPYDMLPEEQRLKDALFGAIVRALMPHGDGR